METEDIMILSKANIGKLSKEAGISIPDESYFNLPEKVLQFGTGVSFAMFQRMV